MKNQFLIMAGVFMLGGCVVHPAEVQVPTVTIDPPVRVITPAPVITPYSQPYYEHRHKSRHKHKRKYKGCPPGLRMQGRC